MDSARDSKQSRGLGGRQAQSPSEQIVKLAELCAGHKRRVWNKLPQNSGSKFNEGLQFGRNAYAAAPPQSSPSCLSTCLLILCNAPCGKRSMWRPLTRTVYKSAAQPRCGGASPMGMRSVESESDRGREGVEECVWKQLCTVSSSFF